MCLPELIDIGISKSTLRWRDTKINDIHDFTLHCYFREKTVPSGCFCRQSCLRRAQIPTTESFERKLSTVTKLQDRPFVEQHASCMLDEELLATQARLPCQDAGSLACFSRSSIQFVRYTTYCQIAMNKREQLRTRVARSKSDATKPVDMLDELAEQFSARYHPHSGITMLVKKLFVLGKNYSYVIHEQSGRK